LVSQEWIASPRELGYDGPALDEAACRLAAAHPAQVDD